MNLFSNIILSQTGISISPFAQWALSQILLLTRQTLHWPVHPGPRLPTAAVRATLICKGLGAMPTPLPPRGRHQANDCLIGNTRVWPPWFEMGKLGEIYALELQVGPGGPPPPARPCLLPYSLSGFSWELPSIHHLCKYSHHMPCFLRNLK